MEILRKTVEEKLNNSPVQLSIGCGLHWKQPFDSWINIDGVENEHTDIVCTFYDIPLPDKCADFLELGDVIEHLEMWNRDKGLKEWFRLLKIGGKIRISTPNLHRVMVDYANNKLSLKEAIQCIYAWMTTPYEQHYYTYTVETLTKVLEEYGFRNIDFSESPGVDGNSDKNMSWWLVCSATKERDV